MMKPTGSKPRRSKSEIESGFQEKAIALIKAMGGYVNKVHVSAYQGQGEPDIDCCYKGFWISFELKIEGNTTSKLQDFKIEEIRRAGGIAKSVKTLTEIKETLYEISRLREDSKSEE